MSTFRPSQVSPFFPKSVFHKGEKEAIAAFLVNLLVEQGDEWKEVTLSDFLKHIQRENNPAIHMAYIGMAQMFPQGMFNALLALEADGYLAVKREEKEAYITATEKMVEFYEPYAC